MAQKVREVMTADPATVDGSAPATEAAALMRERDTGAIVVTDGDRLAGLLTDRDIVVRAVADGHNPADVKAGRHQRRSSQPVTRGRTGRRAAGTARRPTRGDERASSG